MTAPPEPPPPARVKSDLMHFVPERNTTEWVSSTSSASGSGPGGRTREQLYNDAKKLNISGRSGIKQEAWGAMVSSKIARTIA